MQWVEGRLEKMAPPQKKSKIARPSQKSVRQSDPKHPHHKLHQPKETTHNRCPHDLLLLINVFHHVSVLLQLIIAIIALVRT